MGIFSIFKIGVWFIAAILGFFAVKKVVGSKRQKNKTKSVSNLPKEKLKEKEQEKERILVYEEKTVDSSSLNNEPRKIDPEEKNMRKDLKGLLIKISELIDRGFDQGQVARSLAANSDREIPKYELVPLVDALRRFLSGYDEKTVKAQEMYNPKAANDYKAVTELRKGNPEFAISILERKLSQLEGAASEMRDEGLKMNALAQAAEYARHIAVLSEIIDINNSYEFAQRSVELNAYDIKNLDLLGYYELGFNNIDEAQSIFEQALSLSNENEEKIWIELAQEGLEIAKSKKPDDVHIQGPAKVQSSIGMNEIAAVLEQGHERAE